MDENDPIYEAVACGVGRDSVGGVLEEIAKAGYVIRKASAAGASQSERVRAAVLDIIEQDGGPSVDQGETAPRLMVKMLATAWCDAVRAEWNDYVATDPELAAQVAVARELMIVEGYTMEAEPICGLPGAKPMVAVVDGKEAVCLDYSMGHVMPLSAIYTNKVREVMSAAARVSKALAEQAAKEPLSWPIVAADGAVYNSIEEMQKSPALGVRELAAKMVEAEQARAAEPPGRPAKLRP